MAVVIRLKGLPFIAGPVDIRRFFTGLTILDGGVHIIGGKVGEAFIIFATDEDARRAISRSGGLILNSSVELFLSSKAEMQRTIGIERPGPEALGVGSFSNFVEDVKEKASHSEYGSLIARDAEFPTNGTECGDSKSRKTRPSKAESPYLFLRGLPYLVNEDDVRAFFSGLWVDGVIFLKHHDGRNNGDAIVKFASCIDASGGLKCHRNFMGSRFIEVMQGSEEQWIEFGGHAINEGNIPMRTDEHSPPREMNDRHSRRRSLSKSPRRTRPLSPHGYYVQLKNLSLSVNKKDLRNFFRDTDLTNEQIKFLYKDDRRTRNAFVMFKTLRDYNTARGLHKTVLQYRPVHIDPVSRKDMLKLIKYYEKKRPVSVEKMRLGPVSQKSPEGYSGQKLCIYIRNFPFDVTKIEVQKFFADFLLAEDDIYLLYDDKGVGLGEALVKFKSEEQAMRAERLNRRRFLGTEVLLRLISEAQMQEFGVNFPVTFSDRIQDNSQSRDGDDHFHAFESNDPFMSSVDRLENLRRHEDLKQPDPFRHPQKDSRQLDRHPPRDCQHSSEDFRCSPEEFRLPRAEHLRRSPEDLTHPWEDCRHPKDEAFRHSREEGFRHPWVEDWRRPSEQDFRQPSEEDSRRPAEGNFRRLPEDLRQLPAKNFRQLDEEEFRHSPEGDSISSPKEHFRQPPQEHFRRRPSPEHFRKPSKEYFHRPPQEHFRRSSQEHDRWSSQEHCRRSPQEHGRRSPQEHCRRSPQEHDRRSPQERDRWSSQEHYRRSPQEHDRWSSQEHCRRSPQEHDRWSSQEHYRRSPQEHDRWSSQEHCRRSPQEHDRWSSQEHYRRSPQEHDRRSSQEHDRRSPQEHGRWSPQEHGRRSSQENFRRPSQEPFRRLPQEHFRRPPQEHFKRSREEDFRHLSDEDFRGPPDGDFRHTPDEHFRSPQEEDFRCPSDKDFQWLPEEDVREAPEDSGLSDHFRSPAKKRGPPDGFRSHRTVVNFGRPESGKFDSGKRNTGHFSEERFVPDPNSNRSADRITPIKIMNLPFKASVNEILDFFHGYRVVNDSVSIQYNAQGLPTGEALVSMINYNEAVAAIKDLNDRSVGPRKVKLILI